MTRLEHALALARQGFFIFPLRPGSKEPFSKQEMGGRGWKEYMTTDEAVISGWFQRNPKINYAVSFGERGFILDPDMDASKGKDGLGVLADMEAENFEEPVSGLTFTVRSPRGGQHLYFMSPYSVSNARGDLPAGIDVRGRGGYVVGPGSHTVADPEHNTAEGDYEVIHDLPPMEAPEWLLEKLERVGGRNEHVSEPLFEWDQPFAIERAKGLIVAQTHWPVEGQNGDDATYQFVAFIRDFGISAGVCFDLLTEPLYSDSTSWNDRCEPPWQDDALQRKIENVYSYATNAPGQKGGLLDSMDDAGQEYADLPSDKPKEDPAVGLDAIFFPGGSLLSRSQHREMIIPDWLMAHGMTALLAKRSTGKTVTMLDMACRIACDMDWYDMPIAKGWACIYACGEDDLGLQEQYAAWIKHTGIVPEDDRFIIMAATPNLLSPDEAEAWTRYLLGKLNGRRAVFFVDTWQRATSRASQNDDDEMQTAVAHVEAMAKSFHGPSVVAFHPPKANERTMMGSSVPENSTVAIWQMTKEAAYRLLEVTRIKGKGEGSYQRFKFNEVELGEKDEFGAERTGVVMESLGGSKQPENQKLTEITADAKFYYASIISKLYFEAEDNEEGFEERRKSAFTLDDTARRIEAFARENSKDQHLMYLRRIGDTAFLNSNTLRRHLSDLFVNKPVQEIDGGFGVSCVSKGRKQQFVVHGDTTA